MRNRIVLILGHGAQRPVALFGTLYAPCSPFDALYAPDGPFDAFYAPGGPFNTLYAPSTLSVSVHLCVLFVCKSPKRLFNGGTQKDTKCTKNPEENSQVTLPFTKKSAHNYRRN